MARALLFDVGEVMMEPGWVQLDRLERRTGQRISGRGPYDVAGDHEWQRYLAGEISGEAYWDAIARAAGFVSRHELFRSTSEALGAETFAPDALALIADARAAGVLVGILTNDLVGFSGREWVDARPELTGFDVFVDSTDVGARKPAPAPYLKAIADFGLPAGDIVFLDDTPECVEGARAVGMVALHVDPTNRAYAFDRARALVGLTEETAAERLVRAAETAYDACDLAALQLLFHPDVIVHWNGAKVAAGWAQARQFHLDHLGFDAPPRPEHRLRKTLRAVDGDTLCVEWEASYRNRHGRLAGTRGGELWTVRYGRVIEWRAYAHRWEEEGE